MRAMEALTFRNTLEYDDIKLVYSQKRKAKYGFISLKSGNVLPVI
jgi:hypothetical protein